MNRKTFAIIALVPFSLLTLYALFEVGYVGIFKHLVNGPAGWQIFADLAIALLLVFSWLIPEAKKAGRNPWPWLGLTLFSGSIGPLLYLATSKSR